MSGALQTMHSSYVRVFQSHFLLVLVGRRTNNNLCCESEYHNLTIAMDHSRISHK